MKDIVLPKPSFKERGNLFDALKQRRTKRKIVSDKISIQEVSNILFAACGETRKATTRSKNRRTIPSACNSQKVRLYVALKNGLYKYVESGHKLVHLMDGEFIDDLVNQKMLKGAPLGLIYIGDNDLKSGIIKHGEASRNLLFGVEVGAMSQNVYLYCAANNLNTVLVGLFDREKLREVLKLKEDKEIIYTQVVS